eukprot:1678224-Amphidinium_carterae.1
MRKATTPPIREATADVHSIYTTRPACNSGAQRSKSGREASSTPEKVAGRTCLHHSAKNDPSAFWKATYANPLNKTFVQIAVKQISRGDDKAKAVATRDHCCAWAT